MKLTLARKRPWGGDDVVEAGVEVAEEAEAAEASDAVAHHIWLRTGD